MTKKLLLCMAAIAVMLITCAYADGDPEELPFEEDTENVLDVSETDESVLLPAEGDNTSDPAPSDSGAADPVDPTPYIPVDENDSNEVMQEEEQRLIDAMNAAAALRGEEPTPTPEPTPEPGTMTIEEETLDTLGRIYALLIFFTVVLLLYFSYKFLRIFF